MAMDAVAGNSLKFLCLLLAIADVVDLLVNCKWMTASASADGSGGMEGQSGALPSTSNYREVCGSQVGFSQHSSPSPSPCLPLSCSYLPPITVSNPPGQKTRWMHPG
ncbi:hypothetical protein TSMEX_008939, partial [Taenia solium]